MSVLLITILLGVRYYLAQRDEFDAVAARLRDDVSGDLLAAYNTAYNAGAATRRFYAKAEPTLLSAYEKVRGFVVR